MADSTKHTSQLKDRKVLILGGSSGLGYGAAEACIEHGMIVVISSSSEERVQAAIGRILQEYPSAKGRLSGHACDLGDQTSLEDNIVRLFAQVGKLDHIIYSAGDSIVNVTKPLDQIDIPSAVKSHMVRYFAPMMVGKHAKKYLSPGPRSSITFTSGAITLRPRVDWVLAGGVMAALHGLSQQLALELAPIRVNTVMPGAVETEMWDQTMSKADFAGMKASVEKSVPTRRLAQGADLAEAYLYTLKDINMTGNIIKSDSGGSLV